MKTHPRRPATPALRPLALAIATLCLPPLALAAGPAPLPTGLQVVQGQATLASAGNRLTVTHSANAVLNWQQFSIAADQAVHFAQPSAASKVLNRVVGSEPSAIFGSLSSNGQVWLLNPNGVLFGAGARVDVAALVASTLRVGDADWAAGRLNLSGSADGAFASDASVVNQGTLRTVNGGRVMLIGSASVRNEGLIDVPGGQVLLAAGRSVELVDTGLPNLSVKVSAPQGEAVNLGTLLAGSGRVDLQAALVNQQGIVRADGLGSGRGGEVVLTASSGVALGAGSQTSANGASGGRVSLDGGSGTTLVSGGVSATGSSGVGGGITLLGRQVGLLEASVVDASGAAGGGAVRVGGGLQGQDPAYRNADALFMAPGATIAADATASGDGGLVVLWSDLATRVYGSLSARGGPFRGNGGFIETSGGWLDARPLSVRTDAPAGRTGQWLLDPFDIVIADTGTQQNIGASPNFTSTGEPSLLLTSTIVSALGAVSDFGSDVTVTTGAGGTGLGDITMSNASIVSQSLFPHTLTLSANRNILISGSTISGSTGGSTTALGLSLVAGQAGNPASAGTVTIQNSSIDTKGTAVAVTAYSGAGSGGSVVFDNSTVRTVGGNVTISTSPAGAVGGSVRFTRAAVNAVGGNVSLTAAAGSATSGSVDLSDSMIRSGGGSVPPNTGNVAVTVGSGGTSTGTLVVANPLGQIFGGPSIVANGTVRINADSVELGTGAQLESQTSGVAISLQGGAANTAMRRFVNNSGASALVAPSRRWLVHVIDSEGASVFTPGGLAPDFWQYNALPDSALPQIAPSLTIAGNGFRFAAAPTLVSGFSRVYDGTTSIDLAAFQAALTGLRTGHSLAAAPSFSSVNAASAVPVSLAAGGLGNLVTASDGKPVYGYQGTASLVGDISRRPVSVTGVGVDNKTYDGNTTATVNSWSLSNVIPGDLVTASGGGLFDTALVGSNKPVAATATSLGGSAAGNYRLGSASATGSASISQRTLSVTGVSVADKVYDGSTAATVTGFSLGNLVAGDPVQAIGTGSFDSAGVGDQKLVLATAVGLTGAAAGNYSLDPLFSLGGALAAITPRPLTMIDVVVASKVYDGNTAAAVTGWTLSGLVPNERVNTGPATGQFATASVGDNKPVATRFSLLPGLGGANYVVVDPGGSAVASITPRPLTLASVTVADKVYDGRVAANVTSWSLSNVVGSEQVQVGNGVGRFSSAGAGMAKPVLAVASSLTGPDAGNYRLGVASQSSSAAITPAPLLYLADPARALQGLPLPPLSGTVTGFVDGETRAGATTGTLRFDALAGPQSAPGRYAIEGSGLSAVNYVFAQAPSNATALTLLAPQPPTRTDPPINPYLTRTAVTRVLPAPEASSPSAGRALDAMPALLTGGTVPAFASLDLDNLSPAALAAALAARGEYKRTVFQQALAELELDPTRADAPPCETARQADAGECLLTGPLGGERLVDRASSVVLPPAAAPAPAPAAGPAVTPAPPAAAARAAAAAAPARAQPPQPVVDLPARRPVKLSTLPQIQRKIALLIGIDQYSDARIPRLGNAVNDARAVAASLEANLGYETVVLADANRSGVFRALNQLVAQAGPADSVLVYYAGHGERSEKSGLGYWQPADADPTRPETWISNADIDRALRQMQASQVAMISDSCFSGSLASGERIRGAVGPQDPTALLGRRATVVMTSGGNEPVFDAGKNGHSPFAWSLMQSLQQVSSWKPGSSVFEQVRFAVARQLPQRPQYAAAPNAGHQAGADFVFEHRLLEGVVK